MKQEVKVYGDWFMPEMRMLCNQLELAGIVYREEAQIDLLTKKGT